MERIEQTKTKKEIADDILVYMRFLKENKKYNDADLTAYAYFLYDVVNEYINFREGILIKKSDKNDNNTP